MHFVNATSSTVGSNILSATAPAMLAFIGVIAANLLTRRSTGRWETMHLFQWSIGLIADGGRKAQIGMVLLNQITESGLVSKNDLAFVRAVGAAAENWLVIAALPTDQTLGETDKIVVKEGDFNGERA